MLQATTMVPELKRRSMKMLLHNYWTEMVRGSEGLLREVLVGMQRGGAVCVRDRLCLCKLLEQTVLSIERQ